MNTPLSLKMTDAQFRSDSSMVDEYEATQSTG